jgi:hypothetical protein
MREKIESLRGKFNDYQEGMQKKLQHVIEIITGVATPEMTLQFNEVGGGGHPFHHSRRSSYSSEFSQGIVQNSIMGDESARRKNQGWKISNPMLKM